MHPEMLKMNMGIRINYGTLERGQESWGFIDVERVLKGGRVYNGGTRVQGRRV